MRATSVVFIIGILAAHSLWAQLDLLTPDEASRIVKQIPRVVAAAERLPCPILADVTGDPEHAITFDVEVRAGCHTSMGSSLIDRYVVNRRNGAVTTWGDDPSKVGGRASEALAEELIRHARNRLLSVRESRCLALEAARGLPGWDDAPGSISIEPVASRGSPETVFHLSHKSLAPPVEARATLYVDPRTGHVRNEAAAAEVMSAGLGELLAKLIALRSPILLNARDALSVALRVPSLAEISRRKGCSLIASSESTPELSQVAPACDGHYVEGAGIAVNLRDGVVSDADTGKVIDAPEAALLASSLISAVHEARLHLQEEVDGKCGGSERR